MLTKPQRRALEILDKETRSTTAHWFAQKMWPRTDERYRLSWERTHNCGVNGATTGAPMWRLGGRFLTALTKKGWVRNAHGRDRLVDSYLWEITNEGRRQLA